VALPGFGVRYCARRNGITSERPVDAVDGQCSITMETDMEPVERPSDAAVSIGIMRNGVRGAAWLTNSRSAHRGLGPPPAHR